MTCQNCGATVSADDKFCPICGISTADGTAAHYCAGCGSALGRDDKFCIHCGAQTDYDPEINAAQAVTSSDRIIRIHSDPYAGRTSRVVKILALTLLLLSASLFLYGSLTHWWHF